MRVAAATFANLPAVADAYVSSAATSSNFGAATELRSDRSTHESYLKFDLTSLGPETVVSAKLRLTGQLNDASGMNVATEVFSVSDTSWTETDITWSNKPNSGTTALGSVTVTDNAARLYEWDVTAFVKAEMNANPNVISLALKNPLTSTPYATFNSREAVSSTPELFLTTTLPPTVTITSPATGTSFPQPATITITADATDTDGISKVEFYQGKILLGTTTIFPYSFTWTGMSACSYLITAKATDTLGVIATSVPVLVKVSNAEIGESTPPNFKIAFFGDQGLGSSSVATLNLVKDEGAQALVISGDLDYSDNPAAWEAQLNSVVGPDFPVLTLIGNHDEAAWLGPAGYQKLVQDRFNRLGISWCGDLGVQSSFHYKGIFFVFTSPGIDPVIDPGSNDIYIRDELASDRSIWSISSWHKDMHLMQAGGKSDETGWGVYEESRAGGAIIATAHEHSYFRTHLLSSIMNQTVASPSNTLTLTPGNSFVFVSGLGGQNIRDQVVTGPWIAKIYANPCLAGDTICQPNAVSGAMFGVFNVDGQQNKANFYFKDINGQIIDSFTVISQVDVPSITSISPSEVAVGGDGFALTVNGSNFLNESLVLINGTARPTTFGSSTQLTAQVSAADILSGGTMPITVFNAVTGGGTSSAVNLAVTSPVPSIATLSPVDAERGGSDFTLTVNGSNFVGNAIVRFNGLDRPTSFLSNTKLTALITAADIAIAGSANVTVFNPSPGGGTSSAVVFNISPDARSVLVVNVSGSANSTITIPIQITAQGDENTLDFSLAYDTTVLSDPQTTLGSDSAGAMLSTNTTQVAQGHYGIALSLPSGQSLVAGTRQIVNITFTTAAVGTQTTTQIDFGDQPIARQVLSSSSAALPAGYISGTVTITIGYEGDVAPRPNGSNNGTVSIADWVQAGRFAAGLDIPNPGSEFQRADCAPKSSFGNGSLTISDWVQAGRYASGVDPVVPAGGPASAATTIKK
jgi:Big-like domain-containing protein/cohesin domain-containing protein/calcineurin-like phosphoesterase family protein